MTFITLHKPRFEKESILNFYFEKKPTSESTDKFWGDRLCLQEIDGSYLTARRILGISKNGMGDRRDNATC